MSQQSMNIGKIASDIAQVWGMPDFASAPDFAQERIRIEINAAIQQMQDAGEDFYGRDEVTVELFAGTSVYELPSSIQTVLDPIVLEDGTPLVKLTTRGQMRQYGQVFANQFDNNVPAGKPEAFFIEVFFTAGEDTVRTVLNLFPAPNADNIANQPVVPVINEAALFSTAQLAAGTAALGIPHKYIESIFLPLARYNASTCFLFYKQDSAEKYKADYERALRLLGRADPRQPKLAEESTDALELPATQQQPRRNQ